MRPEEIAVARRENVLRELAAQGLVERDGEHWRLTERGRCALPALLALAMLAHADALAAAKKVTAPLLH